MFWRKKKKAKDTSSLSSPKQTKSERKNKQGTGSHLDLITQFEREFGSDGNFHYTSGQIRQQTIFTAASDMSPEERADFLVTYAQNIPFIRKNKKLEYGKMTIGHEIFCLLIKRKTNFTPQHLVDLFTALGNTKVKTNHWQAAGPERNLMFESWAVGQIVNQLEKSLKIHDLTDDHRKALTKIAELEQFTSGGFSGWGSNVTKARDKLISLISGDDGKVPEYKFTTDPIGQHMSQTIWDIAEPEKSKWQSLLHQAETATGAKPTKKFQTNIDQHIEAIGTAKFKTTVQDWIGTAVTKDAFLDPKTDTQWDRGRLNARMSNLLKGLVWGMARFHDEKSVAAVARLADKSFHKIPGIGPGAQAVGNACIYVLANSKGLGGVAHLSRLKLRVKQSSTQKLIQKHIEAQAAKQGLKAAQIEDMAAPSFGLDMGIKSFAFKDYNLVLSAVSPGRAELKWYKPDGLAQKSVPNFVKESKTLSAVLKKARDQAKEIKKASTAQRDRIDRLYTEDMSWTPEDFDKYYLSHGLIGPMARKLIWQITSGGQSQPALYRENRWENAKGGPIEDAPETLQLWHPIMSETEQVLAWRERLQELEICQPLKQAYREVYILTDAEINTRVYSNRMAAHILKQHQFNALAGLRGWKYQLMGSFDNGIDNDIALKTLPAYNMSAEFWIDEMAGEDSFNDTGIWDYVATDQVRFKDAEDQPIDLIDVPPIILSEILRDTDLFVGVASVGNDPEWSDRGGTPRAQAYWRTYSFGDLSETAKTRKAVLENLIPRLKIRDVAKIDGRYLIVQGKRHSYKIHIGSGNILIQPSDRYLCIVAGRGKDKNLENLFLPFEGDRGLSLILSKAFMLAEDDKIKDKTILSQL